MTTNRKVRRCLTPVLGMAMALTLSACGSSTQSGSGAAPAPASSLNSLSMAQLATAAAKEGSVTWYTTFADTDVQPIVAAFNKVYPNVKINALRLSAEQIPPRVMTEQRGGKFNADVISGDSPQVAQLQQAGALDPYDPADEAALPAGLSLPAGYRGVVYANTTVLAYNPTVLKQKGLTPPKSWQDLTQPQWKGLFSIDSGAVNWYDSLITAMGHDKALALLKGLGNNSPRFVASHTLSLTQVQAGEPPVSATAYGYKASSLSKKTPNQLAYINAIPLPTSLNLVDLAKNPPHPNAARLFESWLVSQQGQQAVIDTTNHTSIRSDVKNDPKVYDPNTWTPSWGRPLIPAADYNQLVQEMKSALKAP